MPKITKEDKEIKDPIKEKLAYLGLDLEQIPEVLQEFKPLEYRPYRMQEENTYKIYRYVPVSKIQILLSPTHRLNSIKEKYQKAKPLYCYLDGTKEENIMYYTTFLKMLKEVTIEKIQKIEEKQEEVKGQIPFKVKFEENYLWQIYYSEPSDTYFMLVPTEELEYEAFFYLIKKQIECAKTKKEEKIYVPISDAPYSGELLKKSEIADIEKYLWLFTKDWPMVYEVTGKKGEITIQIVGTTICYENIKTDYRIKLASKEEAQMFYKLVKALFILQSELPHDFHFSTKINQYGTLEFENQNKKLKYDGLAEFLKKVYEEANKQIEQLEKEEKSLQTEMAQKREISKNQELEYLQKERQIAMYLECRKTFFGKVKYFFTSKKSKKHVFATTEELLEQKQQEEIQESKQVKIKEYYTIEEVIAHYRELGTIVARVKNERLDLKALQNKIDNMEIKIKNATLYIEEIDSHEKSIFEFWKFANKDENLMLEQGEQNNKEIINHIEKVFEFEDDILEIGQQIDKQQRNKLTKEELDAVFMGGTELLALINAPSKKEIKESLIKLKEEAENSKLLFNQEEFDIFGARIEDNTKIRTLGDKKHREIRKDKLQILEINKKTTQEEYQQKIEQIKEALNEAIKKGKAPVKMPLYKVATKEIPLEGKMVVNLNAREEIQKLEQEKNIYFYRIMIKKDMPIIYFSNSTVYDNTNRTLPIGMNVGTNALLDFVHYQVKLTGKREFRINTSKEEIKPELIKVKVLEYELEKREENDQ